MILKLCEVLINMDKKDFTYKLIDLFKREDYYLAFLCLTAWLNFLQLNFIGIHSNLLLIPLVFYSLCREILFLGLFIKNRNEHNVFNSIIVYVLSLIGILPFQAEKKLKKINQVIFRAPRLLYFYYLITSIIQLLITKNIEKQMLVQILLFYIIMVSVSRLVYIDGKEDILTSTKNEINLCLKAVFLISIITGTVQFLMLLFNSRTGVGVYGKGLIGIMGNSNSVGITSGVAMIASIYIIQKSSKFINKNLAYYNLFIHCITLVFCNSRTSLLTILFSFIVAFLFTLLEKENRQTQIILLLSIIATVFIFTIVKPYVQNNYLKNNLDSSRQKSLEFDFSQSEESTKKTKKKQSDLIKKLEKQEPKIESSNHYMFYDEYPLKPEEIFLKSSFLLSLNEYTSGRIQLWKEAWLLFKSNIFLGSGFSKFYIAFSQRVSNIGISINTSISSSHNLIFDMLWMGGIVGFIIGVFIFIGNYFSLLSKSVFRKRYYFHQKKDKKLKLSFLNEDRVEFNSLFLIGIFIGLEQMFEITAIISFNISTICFWLFLRWNMLYSQKYDTSLFSDNISR